MVNSYIVTCNLIEIQHHKLKVRAIVRAGKCVGFSGAGENICFHFITRGHAMMVFLELEHFLDNVSFETSSLTIDKTKLKGVFKYD